MVSRTARVLFVHVQKTGGSTIDLALEAALPDAEPVRGLRGGRHATWAAALEAHPELADHWSFGFVRNPWARLVSWHDMIMRRAAAMEAGNEAIAHRIAHKNPFWRRVITEHPTLESFVLEGLDEIRRARRPQLDYLRTDDRTVDFIGRMERFDEDVRTVFDHLGLGLPDVVTTRHNAGPGRDYRQAYSAEMRDKVAEVFAVDIETFGYDFDDAGDPGPATADSSST